MSRVSLFKGLRKYLIEKSYNQSFGDLVPVIAANALKVCLTILNESPNGQFSFIMVAPSPMPLHKLILHRKGEHYNGIVPTTFCQQISSKATDTPEMVNLHRRHGIEHHVSSRDNTNTWAQNAQTPIKIRITNREDLSKSGGGRTGASIAVPLLPAQHRDISKPRSLKCALLNACSAKQKTANVDKPADICELVIENNIDILAITETWIRDNTQDSRALTEMTPTGYVIHSVPRKNRRGGGLALIHRSNIEVTLHGEASYSSFECLEASVKYAQQAIALRVIYRPPANGLIGTFFENHNISRSTSDSWRL